jgi:hypothetical protein
LLSWFGYHQLNAVQKLKQFIIIIIIALFVIYEEELGILKYICENDAEFE